MVSARERGYGGVLAGRFHFEVGGPFLRDRSLGAGVDESAAGEFAAQREGRVAGDGQVHDEALLAPVFGHEGEAGADCTHGVAQLQGLAEGGHRTTVCLVDAHDRAHDLGSACTDEARKAEDFTAADLEAHVLEGAISGETFDRQHGIADLCVQLGEELIDVAANHVAHELHFRGPLQVARRHVGAVAHDRHVVAQIKDFLHPVRDEHEGSTLVAQRTRNGEEALDLVPRQGGRRLIHDEDLRVQRDRFRDFDDLLVRDRQTISQLRGVDGHFETVEELLRVAPHGRVIDEAEASPGLSAHVDVLSNRQVGKQRGLLVDHRDSGGLRFRGGLEAHRLPVDQEFSGVWLVDAGENLDERRLARTVFTGQGVNAMRIQLDAAVGHGREGAELLHRVLERDNWPFSFSCHVVTSSSRNETIQITRKCATRQYACQLYA